MASGGIVTRPTVALIGEAGPEAVIPLGRGGGLGNVTLNVYAMTANAEVGRKVFEALREYERTSGRALAS
jgi:phage-related minor tail protein